MYLFKPHCSMPTISSQCSSSAFNTPWLSNHLQVHCRQLSPIPTGVIFSISESTFQHCIGIWGSKRALPITTPQMQLHKDFNSGVMDRWGRMGEKLLVIIDSVSRLHNGHHGLQPDGLSVSNRELAFQCVVSIAFFANAFTSAISTFTPI